ncbi:MAG: hypothetical protein OXT67_10680 [Zetaproteobacteria bacterium]|nr:hypothetical protein [Zetaproteobacteria bacterium]
MVLKNNATYWKGVTDGSIVPWSELREEWPKHVATVAKLQKDHAAILNETDPKKREALSVPFFSALQLIGPYLQASDYRNTDLSLTPDEAKELDALESADIGPAPPDPNGKTLQALTPTEVFTLLDFSVPLEIKGPPETEVFLSSGGGGVFENNLTMQRLKTDKQGLARSSWVSRGDSVGLSMITATSPACGNELAWQIEVVHLALMPLPPLPKTPVVK